MIPQIVFIVLLSLGIGSKIRDKGKESTENVFYNVLSLLLLQGLYYWGGFWNQGQWPQFMMAVFIMVALVFCIKEHDKKVTNKGLNASNISGTIFLIVLLYFGHFFDPIINFFK